MIQDFRNFETLKVKMRNLNESQTREQKIDVLLYEQGWNVKGRAKVILEVNTKQSEFERPAEYR